MESRPICSPYDDLTLGPNGRGSALVLNTNDPDLDTIETVPVASGLGPGPHEMVVTASRGWDQWAIKGFAVGYRPETGLYRHLTWLITFSLLCSGLALYVGTRSAWPRLFWAAGGSL